MTDWAHIESLRGWAMLAARGHAGAIAVMQHPDVQAAWGRSPLGAFPAAPAPAPVKVVTPQAPRAIAPAVPQTPALAGVTRRAEALTALLGARPTPVAPTDNLV